MNFGFKGLHPITNLIFFIFAFIVSLTSTNPLLLLICFICGGIYSFKLQGRKIIPYVFKFILPFILLIAVFNGLFSHYGVTVLFVMKNGNNFTLEAVIYGIVSGVRIGAMLLWLESFNEIITGEKIIFLFGRLSPRLALVISMVLRFIPLIRSQSQEIIKAEKGIGGSLECANFINKIRILSRRLSILVSWTLEKGIDTSDSMRARGYALKGRTSYNDYLFLITDGAAVTIFTVAIVLSFILSDKLQASYNPVIAMPTFDTITNLTIIFFTFVLLLPLIFDLREEKLWSTSK